MNDVVETSQNIIVLFAKHFLCLISLEIVNRCAFTNDCECSTCVV